MSRAGPGGLAGLARRDPDRFLSALFVPAARRVSAFALIAFNHELARAVDMPSARSGAGPIATLIRLQWWREVVEDARADWHGHPVAAPIRALLDDGIVSAATLAGMIAARETEAEAIVTLEAWHSTMLEGAGGLQRALGEALQVPEALLPRIEAVGAAYGVGALRRHLGAVLRAGRCPLPDELLDRTGLTRAALLQDPGPERLPVLAEALEQQGRMFLKQAETPDRIRLPRMQMAAVLPLVLARRDLSRDPETGVAAERGVGDRLAVLVAYARGSAGADR